MKFKFKDNTEFVLDEGVNPNKFLALRAVSTRPKDIKVIFLEQGYDLKVVPGEFLKVFAFNDKEIDELTGVLKEIEELGLKAIFNLNLRVQTFKRTFLERVKYCIHNNVTYLNEDNTFRPELNNAEAFAEYTAKATPLEEVKTVQEVEELEKGKLDEEDNAIKYSILKTLTEINQNATDSSITFIISTIMANLDDVIAKDNKNYRVMGTKHLIENALQGVNLDDELEYLINKEILTSFPGSKEVNSERGMGA